MSVLNTLPAPVIQMGLVEKIAEVAQNQPHVQQLVAQEEAKKTLKAESDQVAETDKSRHSRKVRDKAEEEGRDQRQARSGQRQAGGEGDEPPAEEEGPNRNGPWTGHIVKITV